MSEKHQFLLDVSGKGAPFAEQLGRAGYVLRPTSPGSLPAIEYVLLNLGSALLHAIIELQNRVAALEDAK